MITTEATTKMVKWKKRGITKMENKDEGVWCTYCYKHRHTREKMLEATWKAT